MPLFEGFSGFLEGLGQADLPEGPVVTAAAGFESDGNPRALDQVDETLYGGQRYGHVTRSGFDGDFRQLVLVAG